MFSPFKDAHGRPKTLAEVTYADLDQLRELEEGYALEFKRSLSPTVLKKLPKIIASFANSAGGWLVIGIADDDKSTCPLPRLSADYSQIIGESCRRHITPAPRIDVRFVTDPAAPDEGVVIVQVLEGDFPPYVADGVVDVREGSTSGPAASSALVELYGKATRRRLEVREFCRRTVFYTAEDMPLFNLYVFRMGSRAADAPSRDELNEHAACMRTAFKRQGLACRVHHAHDSLIFSVPTRDDPRTPHSAIELFGDESIKLSVPAVLVGGDEYEHALARLNLTCHERAGGQAPLRIMSASDTLARVTRMASILDRYVRARGLAWRQFAVAYELENLAGVVLWSEEPLYLEYVDERGPLYCATTDCLSRVRYLDDGAHNSFRARQFAGSHFFEACGLPLGSPDARDNQLVDALLRS
ncbi:AlbA family DNA-binding domain-containing protein [Collinsella ihumii]|uniref:ATP-binding protein n=1 Tax=Collinsella ihumii TaxID=1720204 RepID=A0ABT7XBQ1_9ACTN|nr:ATP-binding protein [Collinsella ihumii]MDN0062834.1 ATP-binding protein [Collinsella ihumii]